MVDPSFTARGPSLLLKLLLAHELPESWIPPAQILELRTRVRLRKRLVEARTAWQQSLRAQLHKGSILVVSADNRS